MKQVVFHPEAERELEEASDFYESQRVGLAAEFEAEVWSELVRAARMPLAFPAHGEGGAKKCLLGRFPYAVYFADLGDRIWVAAVAHYKRRPDFWAEREPD